MYNGIGLPTPRGSGTNGFVQRNLAHVKKSRQMRSDIVSKPDSNFNKPPSYEIILHQKKRQIESKCLRLRKELEHRGYRESKIEREVDEYRKRKLYELSKVKEHEDGDRMKRSFGIKKDYVDGSSVTQMKRNNEPKESDRVKTEEVARKSRDETRSSDTKSSSKLLEKVEEK